VGKGKNQILYSLNVNGKWAKRTKIRENRTKMKIINLIQFKFLTDFYWVLSLFSILAQLIKIK
jgi:hypothetical protein